MILKEAQKRKAEMFFHGHRTNGAIIINGQQMSAYKDKLFTLDRIEKFKLHICLYRLNIHTLYTYTY